MSSELGVNGGKQSLPDADELLRQADNYKLLCHRAFSSNAGRSVLNYLKQVYCDGNLYGADERATAYMLGQRDLILEIVDNVAHIEKNEDKTSHLM